MESLNFLGKNIRFLRKKNKWSQEALARKLDVKRSNVAAYESKNVEPRLNLLVKIAKLFGEKISDLINTDLELMPTPINNTETNDAVAGERIMEKAEATIAAVKESDTSKVNHPHELKYFVTESANLRKMLEGFKVFYKFKQQKARQNPDIENFIFLLDHMLTLNESLVDYVKSNGFEK